MTAVFDAMAVEYETIQQRRLPVDGYYSESNNSEKESLIPSYGANLNGLQLGGTLQWKKQTTDYITSQYCINNHRIGSVCK